MVLNDRWHEADLVGQLQQVGNRQCKGDFVIQRPLL
jgi:hypothetical protein